MSVSRHIKVKANMFCKINILAFLYGCFFFAVLMAQERQTVGLVLSGGGSKGMAHIGVIRALEEKGIPIDYVAGTSVGAIVGGLYASGYTCDEMEAIFNSPKFNEWLKGIVDEKYIAYFRKEEPTPYWIQPSFKVDAKGINVKMPTSFISPLLIDYEFMSIYTGASVAAKKNFDSLFVPFICVAADIDKQKAHYFRSGELGLSVRASMTFPFIFNPIVLDSVLYFDGGIYDNFPIKEMQKDFHPDIIIGSKVADNFPPPKEGDLMSYLQKMIAQHTNYDLELAEIKGIVLIPDLGEMTILDVTDFKEACDYSYRGYQCVMDNLDSINKLIAYRVNPEAVQKKRKAFIAKIPPLIIDSIAINGVDKVQKEYIRQLLGSGETRSYTIEQMRDYYFRLFSDPNIRYVHPTLIYDTVQGSFIMNLNMKIESTLTPKIGGYISAGSYSEAFFQLDYRRLQRVGMLFSMNSYLGSFYNSVKALSRIDVPTKLPFYMAPNYTYNDWDYFSSELFRSIEPSFSYLKQNEQHIEVEIGFPMTKRGKLSLLPSYNREDDRYTESNVIYTTDIPNKTIFSSVSLGLKLEHNTLDKPQYPSEGRSNSLIIIGVLGEESLTEFSSSDKSGGKQKQEQYHKWIQVQYNANRYATLGRYYNIGVSIDLFGSTQQPFFNYASSLLHTSAFTPTVESSQRFMPEYHSNYYVAPGIQNVIKITNSFQFRAEAYAFLPMDVNISLKDIPAGLSSVYEHIQQNYQIVTSTGFVYHSYIGPISLLFNYYTRDKDIKPYSIILNIGYVFFNKRGLER